MVPVGPLEAILSVVVLTDSSLSVCLFRIFCCHFPLIQNFVSS